MGKNRGILSIFGKTSRTQKGRDTGRENAKDLEGKPVGTKKIERGAV